MLQVYDRVLGSRNETTLWVLTLLVLGIYVFMGVLETIRTWVLVRVGARFDATLNTRVFNASFERSLRQAGSIEASRHGMLAQAALGLADLADSL
jgi:ATP-binding cassette subfamily C exporter for protease/lipase